MSSSAFGLVAHGLLGYHFIILSVPRLFVEISTRPREHQNKHISTRNIIWSLKSTCNVREHFVSGADVSCCVGVADWECVLTFKTGLGTGGWL